MKAVVIYSSKRGATKKYADWIAEDLGCSCIPIAACDLHSLEQFDVVVYGGWLRGSGIVGFDKLKSSITDLSSRLVVFCDGISKNTPENFMQIVEINFGEEKTDVPLFFLGGAYYPAKVTGIDKIMMKVAKHVLVSGSTGGADGEEEAFSMKSVIEYGIDLVDRKNAAQVVSAARKIADGGGAQTASVIADDPVSEDE